VKATSQQYLNNTFVATQELRLLLSMLKHVLKIQYAALNMVEHGQVFGNSKYRKPSL